MIAVTLIDGVSALDWWRIWTGFLCSVVCVAALSVLALVFAFVESSVSQRTGRGARRAVEFVRLTRQRHTPEQMIREQSEESRRAA